MIGEVILFIGIGFMSCVLYQQAEMAIRQRRNYGKKLHSGRRPCGHLVSMRYNGSKKYFFVDEDYILCTQPYLNKKDAIEACQEKFASGRPKQTIFTRVS